MPTILQLRRGTTAENDAYKGSVGELTVDTDLNQLRLHDGSTAGGDTIGDGSGNIQIGVTGNNEIDTSSGNLTIDSAGGTVTIDDNLAVSGNLTVSGTTTTVNSTTIDVQNALVFEGSTSDDYELTLTAGDPTADRTITLPDTTDTLVGKATIDTLTNKTLTSAVLNTAVSGTAILDEDNMASDSATQLATQQSIKAYVDAQVTASDLDFQGDSGGALSIDLDSETMTFTGGTGIDTSGSGNAVTFAIDSTVTTNTGTQTLTNKTINGPDNTITNIANGSLANSSITLGSDTINLGDTTTTITGLSLDGTGTIDLTGSGSKARFNFAGFGLLPTAATYEGMFAYDTTGQVPYVADAGGWTRLQTENDSISVHSDVNITGIADGYILQWSSAQARFNVVANTATTPILKFSDDTSTVGRVNADDVQILGFVGGTNISTVVDDANNTVTINNTI